MAEQVSEFVSEFLDLPAQPPSRAQCVQNIDVAIRPRGPARLRAEDLELGDPVAVANFGQTSLVNIDTLFKTCAERDDDEWIINGEKWFISAGRVAGLLFVMCVNRMFVCPAPPPAPGRTASSSPGTRWCRRRSPSPTPR
jgi:hypothetical protein